MSEQDAKVETTEEVASEEVEATVETTHEEVEKSTDGTKVVEDKLPEFPVDEDEESDIDEDLSTEDKMKALGITKEMLVEMMGDKSKDKSKSKGDSNDKSRIKELEAQVDKLKSIGKKKRVAYDALKSSSDKMKTNYANDGLMHDLTGVVLRNGGLPEMASYAVNDLSKNLKSSFEDGQRITTDLEGNKIDMSSDDMNSIVSSYKEESHTQPFFAKVETSTDKSNVKPVSLGTEKTGVNPKLTVEGWNNMFPR